ncbi:MAG: HipA domain-containing protein [Casimicrobiaceae bacterium]
MVARRRASGRRALSLWANGQRIGVWRIEPRTGHTLEYDPAWAASREGRPLSLSLPMEDGALVLATPAVERYFDNLLPDSDAIRRRIRDRFRASSGDAFDLLAVIGRDCVGALQLLPEDDQPGALAPPTGTPLSEDDVARELAAVTRPGRPVPDAADFRISIAGAQEKTALLRLDGQWLRPTGTTPTTHIFKLPLGVVGNMQADLSTSVENEWLCLKILAQFGLPVASADIGVFGGRKALVVERFDRVRPDARSPLLRLMQEDFCQALGLPAGAKYEYDQGPGMADLCERLLQSHQRDMDLETFWQAQVLFAMLAATDGHAKNFSIRLLAGGDFHLTKLYDVLSAWPVIGPGANQLAWQNARLAMAFRGKNVHYHLNGIRTRHLLATAERQCRIARPRAENLLDALIARTPAVVEAVAAQLPAGFPAKVSNTIFEGLRRSADQFAGQRAE